jgi:hypothetical protein
LKEPSSENMKLIDLTSYLVSFCLLVAFQNDYYFCNGYSVTSNNDVVHPPQKTRTGTSSRVVVDRIANNKISRQKFLAFMAGSVTATSLGTTSSMMAWAAAKDGAAKGTKDDPAFQACLSQCKRLSVPGTIR